MRAQLKLTTLALVAAGLIQGCASQMMVETKDASAAVKKEAVAQSERMQIAVEKKANPTRTSEAYLPAALLIEERRTELPSMFNNEISIFREFNSLNEVAERITFHSGLPVTIAPEITNSDTSGAPAATVAMSVAPAISPGMLPLPGGTSGAHGMSGAVVRMEYKGKVAGFLDLAASRYGVSWRYMGGKIEIYRTLTKTFIIKATPGSKTISSEVSNTASSTASSSADGPKTTTNASLSVWDSIGGTLGNMKSMYGKVYVNQSTGSVTITDIPSHLAQMEEYLQQQNAIMGKQVLLSIKILSVSSRDTDKRGVNLNAVFNSMSKNYGWTFSSAFQNDPSAASLAVRVLDTAGAVTGANIGALAGTSAIITALRVEGEVTTLTSWSGVTMNNQPAPIVAGRDSAYLQSTNTTTTANVGTTTTLTQGTYVTGVSMNIIPHILDGGELILESYTSISSLANMFSQTANGNTVQFPEIDKRKLQNSISMRSGQTLILTGFDQNSMDTGEDSTGFGPLGGGVKRANHNKDILVILITAVTADKL